MNPSYDSTLYHGKAVMSTMSFAEIAGLLYRKKLYHKKGTADLTVPLHKYEYNHKLLHCPKVGLKTPDFSPSGTEQVLWEVVPEFA